MNNLYCPYCDVDLGDHVDDCYESDVEYEHQCSECEKNFVFTIAYYPSFTSNKADCLNGAKHKYKQICGYPTEFFKNKFRCEDCGKKKTIKEDVKGMGDEV